MGSDLRWKRLRISPRRLPHGGESASHLPTRSEPNTKYGDIHCRPVPDWLLGWWQCRDLLGGLCGSFRNQVPAARTQGWNLNFVVDLIISLS